jgi:hypothetical protein
MRAMRLSLSRRLVFAAVAVVTVTLPATQAGAGLTGISNAGVYEIAAFGTATNGGVPAPAYPAGALIAMAGNQTGPGYWVLGVNGSVYARSGAPDYGSVPQALPGSAIGIAANPSGPGYWVATSDGGVFSIGGAPNGGDVYLGASAAITSIAANPTGPGYWLLGSDGSVYALGGAPAFGDARGAFGGWPAVAIVGNPRGTGYWIVSSNGVVASNGAPAIAWWPNGQTFVGAAADPQGGLWLQSRSGSVINLGGAPTWGAVPPMNQYVVGRAIAATPDGGGYWTLFTPPPPTIDNGPRPPANSGYGRRVVYSIPQQRVWIMNADDSVYASYRVSGKLSQPAPGVYHVYYKGTGRSGDLTLQNFVGFAYGSEDGNIGFHRIPTRPDGSQIEDNSQLGTPLSHGCVRESLADSQTMYNWVHVGDEVVATGN